jgi:D-xylose transport system permease protein
MITLTQNPVKRADEASKSQQVSSQTDWRRLFGLRERGVYYALCS